jgi:hypothetical protein
MKRFLLIALPLAVIHFLASWICFTRSEVIRPTESTRVWRVATEVLAFPLVWIQSLDFGFDAFPMLMILNSLLWGSVLAGLARMMWIKVGNGKALTGK